MAMDVMLLDPANWPALLAEQAGSLGTPSILAAVSATFALAALVALLSPPRYVRQKSLFTPAERKFRDALAKAFGGRCEIYAKVRMVDLITPSGKEGGRGWWRAFRRISSKHIDFVLTEADGALLLAIELDDASHARRARRARDKLVERAFAQAGLPLLRVPLRRSGDIDWLRGEAERVVPVLSRRP
jgi:hypothetical protein